jgi:NAD(P)-dependent dehydrogenase (short-subunit alcohol dehydrogenase family)
VVGVAAARTGWMLWMPRRGRRRSPPTCRTADVAALAEHLARTGAVHALVHVAGGARGTDRVEDGDPADWRWMFEANVLSAQLVTAALLPLLRSGIRGRRPRRHAVRHVDGGADGLPRGAGYNAAKAGERCSCTPCAWS